MRKLFLVPVALSVCMSMGGCPSMGSIRSNRSSINEVAYSNQDIAFDSNMEYYVSGGDSMVNGFVVNGNGLENSTQPTKQEQTSEPATPADVSQLVGSWETIRRSDTYLYPGYIEFYENGTFSQGSSEYTHTKYNPEMFYEQPEGWHPVPMGSPYCYGTYTVEGNVITLTILGDSIEEYSNPIVETVTVQSISDSEAVFGSTRYIKNFTPTDSETRIEELCALMGVDLSV